MKYTEGPWHRNIKPAKKYPTVFAGRNTHILTMATKGLSDEAVEANINLVVAAHELLDAAELVLSGLNARIENAPRGAIPVFLGISNLHDAIKKAKGE